MPADRRRFVLSLGAATLAALTPGRAAAQAVETRLVVPYPPGGVSDRAARAVAPPLGVLLGHRVVVENTSEDTGLRAVAEATPDGRTLLMGSTGSIVLTPLTSLPPLPDPATHLAPVALIGAASQVLTVHPSVKAERLDDLIRFLRAHPGTTVGSSGSGTVPHLAGLLFARRAGVEVRQIVFPGSAALLDAHVKGEVQLAFESQVVSQVRSGQLRAIAIMSNARFADLPSVPAASEAGLPGIDMRNWLALFAARGTPPETCRVLAAHVREIVAKGQLAALDRDGFTLRPGSPEQLARYLAAEVERWMHYLRELKLPVVTPVR